MPYRNSTISEPSRSTASATTASNRPIGLAPRCTALPTACICRLSSRPWLDIHSTCQPTIATAASSTLALNSSCPTPLNASARRPADHATSNAPSTPSTIPPPTNQPRRSTPRVAAATTLMISAAASTSRNTSKATAHIDLLHDQRALRGGLMEIAVKAVAPRLERTDEQARPAVRHHDLHGQEIVALELFRRGILVDHFPPHPRVRRDRPEERR